MKSSDGVNISIAYPLTWTLTFLFIVYTAISYPLVLVWEITGSTILIVIGFLLGRWLYLGRRKLIQFLCDNFLLHPLVPFVLIFSIAVTIQTLLANEIYTPPKTLDNTPGYAIITRLLHYSVVIAVVWFGNKRIQQVALGAAIMYSSTFFTPTFITWEAGHPFVPLTSLAIVMLATTWHIQPGTHKLKPNFKFISSIFVRIRYQNVNILPLLIFVFISLTATIFSYSRHESLVWFLNLLTLLAFIWIFPKVIKTERGWIQIAFLVVIFSVALPTTISTIKLVTLAFRAGLWSTFNYRLALAELGSHNLIARSLITGLPLFIAWTMTISSRKHRLVLWILIGFSILIFATTKSWSGWIAAGISCLFVIVLIYGRIWISRLRGQRNNFKLYFSSLIIIFLIVGSILIILRWAPQVRVESYNGRLLRYQATINAIINRPILGVGPGHHHQLSKYYSRLDWLVETQKTRDDPLLSIHRWEKAVPLYTHNLLLEIGYGIGLLGIAVFVWFLIELFQFGIRSLSQFSGQDRILVTGCLVGLVASLGWGVLDVAVVFFPFFTFPAWALIGLLITAPHVFKYNKQIGSEIVSGQITTDETHSLTTGQQKLSRLQHLWIALLSFLVLVATISPLIGNHYYRAAYDAYQNRFWQEANNSLIQAARWDPLNAKYHQLYGEVLINQGEFDEAIHAYETAVRLKRDFSPYYSQLGWLYWLKGDLIEATALFQKAVEVDPQEAWSDGLHAQLGLVYTAQGRFKESIPLYYKTIELDPQTANSFYWVPIQRSDGSLDIVIDPVYFNGPSAELKKRILTHIGKADYTSRLFNQYDREYTPISLNQVLDAFEVEHLLALRKSSPEASRLLATIAEAAQLVGLNQRAERAYLAFQEAFPESAYGYRGLGILYHDQRRLEDAQAMFEKAVKVSTENADSWMGLTEIYIEKGMYKKANEALSKITRISPLDVRLYELKAMLNLDQGNITQAADALEHSLHIRDSIPTRLLLSDLYRRLSQPGQAVRQCFRAIEVVQSTWPRPLDPELWGIGLCLAQSDIDNPTTEITAMTDQQPLIGYILLGHFYRARGDFTEALKAYQSAVNVHPEESAPHYFLGQIYQAIGETDLAKKEYLNAVELDPLESLPLLTLAQLETSLSQQDLAYEAIQTAVETTPGWGETHIALGNTLLEADKLEDAAEHYQKAKIADGNLNEKRVYDFREQLASAQIKPRNLNYVRNDYFTINGEQRAVLYMHPDSYASYSLTLPSISNDRENSAKGPILVFDVATDPESWDLPGDGVTFNVVIESDKGTQKIFSKYIDPKHDIAARNWSTHIVDLHDYAGQTITIRFQTKGGPAGDNDYDWAGWGTPRIINPYY